MSKSITTREIDDLYDNAKKHGALGGKLLGAGGGGFMLLYVPEEKQEEFKNSIKNLTYVPFSFENSGTKIMYNTNIR